MQGRAVMIDLRAHLGDAKTKVGYDQLARILEADGVVIEPGDMVCLHTGFAERLIAMGRRDAEGGSGAQGVPEPPRPWQGGAMSDMDWSTPEGLAAIRAHLAERLDGWTPPVAWAVGITPATSDPDVQFPHVKQRDATSSHCGDSRESASRVRRSASICGLPQIIARSVAAEIASIPRSRCAVPARSRSVIRPV